MLSQLGTIACHVTFLHLNPNPNTDIASLEASQR